MANWETAMAVTLLSPVEVEAESARNLGLPGIQIITEETSDITHVF